MDSLLVEVLDKYRVAVDAFNRRRPYYEEHLAMYVGLQFGFQRILPFGSLSRDDQRQLREVYNVVQGVVRSAVASRLGTLGNAGALAGKSGKLAQARARASHALMRSFLHTDVLAYEELVRATFGSSILGGAWLRSIWDTDVGEFIEGPSGLEREGDARTTYVNVFDALPLPTAKTEREVKTLFHRKLVTLEEAEEKYPTDVEGRPSAFVTNSLGAGEWDRHRSLQDPGYISAGSGRYPLAQIEIVEMWGRPSIKYPGGRFVAFSGSTLLLAAPLPFEWPWRFMFGDNIVPDGLMPQGTVAPVTPLQKTINKTESKIGEWIFKLANPKWIASKKAQVDEGQLLNDEIALVTYNPGEAARPEIVAAQMPSSEVMGRSGRLMAAIDEISGYSGMTQGQTPNNIESARGMAYLTERETAGRSPDRKLFELTVAGALKDDLRLYRDFASDDRMVKVLGVNGKDAYITPFRRNDYDFDTEIVIDLFSGPPESQAQRSAAALEIANAGGFEDTPAAKRFRAYMRMDNNSLDGVPDPFYTHQTRNLMEQTSLLSGELEKIFVLPQDNDDVHLESDDEWMCSPEFLTLPEEYQTFYRQHVAMHEAQRMQKLSRLADEQQMMMPGAARQAQAGREAQQPNEPDKPGQESPGDGGWSEASSTETE